MPSFNLGTYGAEIVLDDSQFNKGLNNAEKNIGKTEKTTQSFGKKAGKVALGAVAGLSTALISAGAAGIGMANKFAETADKVDKTSQKMGISTDAYQELEFALGQVGVSGQTMEKSVGRLNQRLGDTKDNEKYRTAIQNLGIATEDASGKTRNADDVFMESVQALHEMEDSTQQAAMAQEIFGTKTARELMPAITAGGDAIAGLRGEAHELGAVISEDGISSGVLWTDTMDKMKNMMSGVFNTLAQQLLPTFQGLLDWIMAHMPQIQATMQTVFDVIGTIFGTFISVIGTVITWLKTWFQNNQETIDNIKLGFQNFVEIITDLIQGFVDLAIAIWKKYGDTILSFLTTTFENIKKVVSGALDIVKGIIKTVTGFITGDWDKAWEGIKDIFSGIWKIIGGIVGQAINIVKTYIKLGMDNVSGKVSNVLDGIKGFFSSAWDKVTSGTNKFKDTFLSIWDKIKTGIKNVVSPIIGFINGIIGGIESMVNAVSKAINKLPSFDIPDWVPNFGGGTFGIPHMPSISIPKIPSLATGGVASQPTLAQIGDAGVGNPEIVAPKKMLTDIFSDVLKRNQSNKKETNQNNVINVNVEMHGVNNQKDFYAELNQGMQSLGVQFKR
ncbi:hypothetical protein [Paraliobacillus sp. X-1268]|uniref:phage tail protein n=1 Tax=Paraliobacillus sp. X-1268 TaxID=2213193 RepID=UPI000E3C5E1A|nr:hypothetical protein [Paraliobacillus sp. X-1268]